MPSTELSNTVKTCFYSALTLFALAAFAHAQSESIETLGSQHLVSAPAVNNHEHTSHGHSMNRAAPAWELSDTAGQIHSARQLDGRPHVLIFHLGKSCLHCSEQIEKFSKDASLFEKQGVDVLTISTDSQNELAEVLTTFKEPLPMTMLANDSLEVFKSYRAFDLFNQQPLHATIFVDRRGQIRWQDIGKHPFTDTQQLLETVSTLATQESESEASQEPEIKRPTIFFDRSPRVVIFQLRRLSDERLLLVERSDADKKYTPVFREILTRNNVSPQVREEAITALVKLNDSNLAAELLAAIGQLKDPGDKNEARQDAKRTTERLTKMLWRQPKNVLATQSSNFMSAINSKNKRLQTVGYAGLIGSGQSQLAWDTANEKSQTESWLDSIPMIPVELRSAERSRVVSMLTKKGREHSQQSLKALQFIPTEKADTFRLAAGFIKDKQLSNIAVETMLGVPTAERDAAISAELVAYLTDSAEATKPRDRTSDSFLSAMQLVDQLMVSVPDAKAKRYRERLNEVTVRLVKLSTVLDEMRYDVPYFAVEAGRSVQIVLDNKDFMAHNVVITTAGKMKEVAELGSAAGPAKNYLPEDRTNILFATKMVQANRKGRLTFKAPEQVGEYPYVCTFPQHWSRMYGVMVVVEDLDAWMKNPVKPTDPIGNTRSLVAKWTVEDLEEELPAGIAEANPEVGATIYNEATCLQCHQIGGNGGKVGPALDQVYSRHKRDRTAVLREILEPSHRIDKEYEMHKILTVDGLTIVGIIKSKTDTEIKLLVNPESPDLTTVLVDDIEEMAQVSNSLMPSGLMNNFTKEEIYALFAYIENAQSEDSDDVGDQPGKR